MSGHMGNIYPREDDDSYPPQMVLCWGAPYACDIGTDNLLGGKHKSSVTLASSLLLPPLACATKAPNPGLR